MLPYPIYAAQPYVADQQSSPVQQEQENELSHRIDRLTDEVERLREQQASSEEESRKPEVERQQTVERTEPTRIIVFRDGSLLEIQNHAMVGSTLWILSEQHAQKISVSELDTQAIKDVNADYGVEFP